MTDCFAVMTRSLTTGAESFVAKIVIPNLIVPDKK